MADPLLIPGSHERFHLEFYGEGLDKADLKPTTTPEAWGASTVKVLAKVQAVKTGSILLAAILKELKDNWVRVVPWWPYQAYQKLCDAASTAEDMTVNDRHFTAEVRFSEDRYLEGSYCFKLGHYDDPNSNRGTRPQEVLFHELVHAYRFVTKKSNKAPLHGGLQRYDNKEEFYAVLLTDIFTSDKSNTDKTGLRGGHAQGETPLHEPLEAGLDSSLGFFQSGAEVYGLIQQFFADHGEFARDVAYVKASFNPLAAYNEAPHKAHLMSLSRVATKRDAAAAAPERRSP